ncbi:1-acyl-sn-glycerol-3-phosphate acyltransferase [Paraliomyxa miuraensis]|uniref:1-acyl-sn-glycerol-3-phosphate acyltransferase n=1 Tax=Paraliomyxa miuraensis TaxID=376150 RepID=UPI00224FCCC8|nr:1-acyl-sn-glycerol-3-phosphate acyltransferase [Paraliomyxa miuraensis]MCX4245217.1 1-acyl-sn-glycerol-3-phosphate acyltransferase [Paraliomyxa miuraensis]
MPDAALSPRPLDPAPCPSPRLAQLLEGLCRLLITAWIRVAYRFRAHGLHHLPLHGPAVLVCNHISFIDPLLLGVASRRSIRFVMDHRIFRSPALHWFFRLMGTIPIAPRHEDPVALERALDSIAAALERGELLCIFPEGKITHTGHMNEFRRGIDQIVARTPVPVIPMALRGLWGSFFSRKDGPAMRKRPRRFRARLELRCGEPIAPHEVEANDLRARVSELLGPQPA